MLSIAEVPTGGFHGTQCGIAILGFGAGGGAQQSLDFQGGGLQNDIKKDVSHK